MNHPFMKRCLPFVVSSILLLWGVAWGGPQNEETKAENKDVQDTKEISLEDLLNVKVVSASKQAEKISEAPATVIVISRKDIQERGYTTLYEILDDLPGYDMIKTFGDTFVKPYARGYRNTIGDSILVMVDGMAYNHLWYNTVDKPLTCIPLSNVDRIEVVYGPASAVYGANAFQGVINVITSKGEDKPVTTNLNVVAGSFGKRGFDLSYIQKIKNWRLSVASRVMRSDIDEDASSRYVYTSSIFRDPNSWGGRVYGNLLGTYGGDDVSPYTQRYIDLRLASEHCEFGGTFMGIKSGYGLMWVWDHYIPHSSTWDGREYSVFARFNIDITPKLGTTGLVRYRRSCVADDTQDFEVDWLSASDAQAYVRPGHAAGAGFYVLPEYWGVDTSSLSYTQDFDWKVLDRLSLNWGFYATQEVQQKSYQYSPDNPSDGVYWDRTDLFNTGTVLRKPVMKLSDANHFGLLRRGGYIQGKVRLDDHMSFVAGLRNDWQEIFKGHNTVRMGFMGNWSGLSTKVLFGQAYNEPPARLLYGGYSGYGSNVSLKPETSYTIEGSVGYTTKRWSLMGDLYRVTNKSIVITLPSSQGGARNLGTTEVVGLDIHAHLLLPDLCGKEQKLWLYTTSHFKQTSNPYYRQANVLDSEDIPDISKNQLHFGWTATWTKDILSTITARWFSSRDTVATNPVGSLPSYLLVDAYVKAGLYVKGLSAGFRVTNLFDKDYAQPGMRNAAAGVTPPAFDTSNNYVGSRDYAPSMYSQPGRALEVNLRYEF